jgi:hypothetical protein
MVVLLKKIFARLPVFIFFICCGCMHPVVNNVSVSPVRFNIQIPFQRDSKGIILSTYWGAGNHEYNLYLDNHSPTWANDDVIRNNLSVSKSKDFLYNTTTADGKNIEGDVYLCDSISIGQLSFKNVLFYNISNKSNAGKTDGAIGENIMNQGIWKIDFKNHLLTIASSADSIKELQQAVLLPAAFTEKAIEIEVSFRNNIKKKVELDLGYNGFIIMPAAAFTIIADGNKKAFKQPRRFSTPAGVANIEDITVSDSIQVGRQQFGTLISSNELVKETLIGLAFFSQFEFIVIDYINKAVYLYK